MPPYGCCGIPMKDPVKASTARHWAAHPIGTETTGFVSPHAAFTREYFEAQARFRYEIYAPWLPAVAGFSKYRGRIVLDVGCGLGTDLLEFYRGGAVVTGLDLTPRHVQLAKKRFQLFGATGAFVIGDAEDLPFRDSAFDVVYSSGVLHHTPDTQRAMDEIHRVLKPSGEALIILYHRHSFVYWLNIVLVRGIRELLRSLWRRRLGDFSFQRVLAEATDGAGNPLTKAFTRREAATLCAKFPAVAVTVYHLNPRDFPLGSLVPRWLLRRLSRGVGWYLVLRVAK